MLIAFGKTCRKTGFWSGAGTWQGYLQPQMRWDSPIPHVRDSRPGKVGVTPGHVAGRTPVQLAPHSSSFCLYQMSVWLFKPLIAKKSINPLFWDSLSVLTLSISKIQVLCRQLGWGVGGWRP